MSKLGKKLYSETFAQETEHQMRDILLREGYKDDKASEFIKILIYVKQL